MSKVHARLVRALVFACVFPLSFACLFSFPAVVTAGAAPNLTHQITGR
jgi:hypothetical protein